MKKSVRANFNQAGLLAITLAAGNVALAASPIAFHQTNVLGTSLDLQVNTTSQVDAEAVNKAVGEEIERLRKILSTYDPACELSKVNASLQPVRVSAELIEVLELYETWETKSSGAYSAQIGELKKLYQTETEVKSSQIEAVVTAIKTPLWKIDKKESTVQRLADRQINIDSLGKGFIVSRALAHAKSKVPGVDGIMLNIGGDISTSGFGVVGRKVKWTILVADPFNHAENAKPIVELRLTDLSVATSGGYARNIKIGNQKFSHILDPRTGKPAGLDSAGKPEKNSVSSATVIAPDNTTANALATSICVLGVEEGMKLVKSIPGADCLIITTGGDKHRSEGMKKYEIIRAEPAAQSEISSAEGARWPGSYEVEISLPVKDGHLAGERPYVAVWIEDSQEKHVATLAVFGNETRWLRQMNKWSRYLELNNKNLNTITRATRAAGEYKFAWDGKDRDGTAVPQGKYTVWVEVSFEHGARIIKSVSIDCGAAPSTVKIDATEAFGSANIKYADHLGQK